MKNMICFTCRFFRQSGLKCALDAVVRRRLMGVAIAGVPWSVGKHCLYTDGANRATRLGTVVNMFFGENDLGDDFVIFQLQNKPITAKKGHYCTYSNDSPGKEQADSPGNGFMEQAYLEVQVVRGTGRGIHHGLAVRLVHSQRVDGVQLDRCPRT